MSGKYWTRPWNWGVGCSKCSPGCDNCYAEESAWRLSLNPNPKISDKYEDVLAANGKFNGRVKFDEAALLAPLKAKKPQVWFTSMFDPFHSFVDAQWIQQALDVIIRCPDQFFVMCTKRALRMHVAMEVAPDYLPRDKFPLPNLALMTTCCTQAEADNNIPRLLECRDYAKYLGVSLEPLLEGVDIGGWVGTHNCHLCYSTGGLAAAGERFSIYDCEESDDEIPICPRCGRAGGVGTWDSWMGRTFDGPAFDFVIMGGESGTNARPMSADWAWSVQDQCQAAGVDFYFKQWGPQGAGLDLEHADFPGRTHDALPWVHILEARWRAKRVTLPGVPGTREKDA